VRGQTAQFTAVARLSDGWTRDVTQESQWTVGAVLCSTCTAFEVLPVSVTQTGSVTAQFEGDAVVIATYGLSSVARKEVNFAAGSRNFQARRPREGDRESLLSPFLRRRGDHWAIARRCRRYDRRGW
jgi:hypothetical protein